jgi:hypothetical protein
LSEEVCKGNIEEIPDGRMQSNKHTNELKREVEQEKWY